MTDLLRRHYETYPYPRYPLLASVRRCDTYALNLDALWSRFNGMLPPPLQARRILIAGCGSFSPYPFSLANPETRITALDLSEKSLKRARLHALLHRRFNIDYKAGDLLDPTAAGGNYGLIDCYGVLHHLDDPEAGLEALAGRLIPGGIIRIMVYGTARRSVHAVRTALRMLQVNDVASARHLFNRAAPGSRLAACLEGFADAGSDEGVADAFLHPRAVAFTVKRLLEGVAAAGLTPLLFAHWGALADPLAEAERISRLEKSRGFSGNIILYAGRDPRGECRGGGSVMLNPLLSGCTGLFGGPAPTPRLGFENPPLDREGRRFLRRFRTPVPWESLSAEDHLRARPYLHALFLCHFEAP